MRPSYAHSPAPIIKARGTHGHHVLPPLHYIHWPHLMVAFAVAAPLHGAYSPLLPCALRLTASVTAAPRWPELLFWYVSAHSDTPPDRCHHAPQLAFRRPFFSTPVCNWLPTRCPPRPSLCTCVIAQPPSFAVSIPPCMRLYWSFFSCASPPGLPPRTTAGAWCRTMATGRDHAPSAVTATSAGDS